MSNVIPFAPVSRRRSRVAVIGTGISGLGAAWRLSSHFDVTLFEKNAHAGGHSHTVDVETPDGAFPVDTGFIVYNEPNYPNLTALFKTLGVATMPSDMSFAASLEGGGFEYSGSGLSGLFAQRRNLFRPRMWRMIADLLRLYKEGPADAAAGRASGDLSLEAYLEERGYSHGFRADHILPMCAAIWSSPVGTIRQFPAQTFLKFFENHGLMRVTDRPKWRTVYGGSRTYVDKLLEATPANLVCNAGIERVTREDGRAVLSFKDGRKDVFDDVVFACHSDEALRLLGDPTRREREILGAIRYQTNTVYLHRDAGHMPRRRSVWSSWNYISDGGAGTDERVSLTYWMNKLQSIPTETPLLVTLNPTVPPREDLTYRRIDYMHPVFDAPAMAAQRELWTLQGVQNTWFCGAYWGYGFHEDGLQSGLAVAEAMGAAPRPWDVPAGMDRIHWPRDAAPLSGAAE